MPVTSKDPRVQAALDARKKRVAAKRKAASKTRSKAKNSAKKVSLGSGLAETARRRLSGRAGQIDAAVRRATNPRGR